MIDLVVVKKNGKFTEKFDFEKILRAICLSASRVDKQICASNKKRIEKYINNSVKNMKVITVSEIHILVIKALKEYEPIVCEQYSSYVDYKDRFNKCFAQIASSSKRIIYDGDKENANKNSSLISTKKELLSGLVSKELMLEFEFPPEIVKAHNEGWIYIHDLGDRFMSSFNCCLADIGNILKGGFNLNGILIEEPKSIDTACNIICDIILCASSQEYGGFTIPRLDTILAPYVKKTFVSENIFYKNLGVTDNIEEIVFESVWKKLMQGIQTIEYKINCVNNSAGQTPFTSLTFGLDTSKEGRMISKAILETRMKKLGKNKLTAIFPKLIFLHREEVNGSEDSPNYDIKKLAIKCSMENQYPDWLSADAGYLKEVYERTGIVISAMGCRAYLSPYFDKNGREIYEGRCNVGAVTFNCVKAAIESKGDIKEYKKILKEYFDIMLKVHLYTYEKMSKVKAKTNPLMFCEGGLHIKLDQEETIEPILESATASFGYIGLAEATELMTGKKLSEDNSFAIEILSYYKDLINEACIKYDKLFALYGTPSEGLCMKALELDKKTYGIIEGVTDKEWYTNSFHVKVTDKISALKKIEIEKPMFEISTGGRIFYSEWPHMNNEEAVEQYINICMRNGLYMGINFENCTCIDCGHNKFDSKVCPKCGSKNVTIINRVCGYLGISQSNGDTRYNNGKKNEVDNRVKHYNIIKE